MSGFKLDTGGEVAIPAINAMTGEPDRIWIGYRWSDLSPFAQGYIEAALRDFGLTHQKDDGELYVAFSDLAPATLAAMLEDCERALRPELARDRQSQDSGAAFWALRQSGTYADPHSRQHFPPVSLYLADDGKIHQREVGQ